MMTRVEIIAALRESAAEASRAADLMDDFAPDQVASGAAENAYDSLRQVARALGLIDVDPNSWPDPRDYDV